jgi:glycosyltransferase involved in cell wall biosynthesis
MKHVVVLQHRLLHYRMGLFDSLRKECLARGIRLDLVHGQASRRELKKNDVGSLSWAHSVSNWFVELAERDIVWQPLPSQLAGADLIIVMQESRILSNYPLLVSRMWSKRKIAYWGHGRNFQSDAPTGLREKWKTYLLTRVDWWFAYTSMTVELLRHAGYPESKITCLDNAIDTSGFKADLAACSEDAVAEEKSRLGIGQSGPVGLFCGSLYPDKKLDLLVAAADRVRAAIPNFELVVIGDGPSMPQMEDAASGRPWIHLTGVRKGRDKALCFRMADLMLNPGLVGLHVVDAFCAGLVMVTTSNARHSPEVAYLKHGVNGLSVEDSPTAYGNAVIELLSNDEKLARMKNAAFESSHRYTLDNMVRNFADGLEAAVNA